jgi:hypothetical protein
MDHVEAIHGKFAEQYLLGELSPAQRDSFEEHFFDCPLCAEDVHCGAMFVDSARSLLRLEEAATIAPGAFAKFGLPFQAAALAAVCLLCLVGYENIYTIPALKAGSAGIRAPEVLPTVSLLGLGSRAESQAAAAPTGKDFAFEFEIPGGPDFTSYTCEIRDAKDAVKFSLPVSAAQAKDAVRLAIPASALSRGKYHIVVLGNKPGQAPQELSRYAISIGQHVAL